MTQNRTPTVDIVGSIMDLMIFDFVTTSVTDNLDGTYTLTACNTYHIQPQFKVTINSIEYPVLSVVRNVNIVVSGTTKPAVVTFPIYRIFYHYGTPTQTSIELTEKARASDKLPLSYFCIDDNFEEEYFGRNNPIDRKAQCRIFFLSPNPKRERNATFQSENVQPMTDLALEFIDLCRASRLIGKFDADSFRIKPKQNVSITTSGQGKKHFTNEPLSGVELNISLPIYRQSNICPCDIVVIPTGMTYEDIAAMTYEALKLLTYDEIAA